MSVLLSVGHGYSAQALARVLLPQGWRIVATTRSAEKAAAFFNIDIQKFRNMLYAGRVPFGFGQGAESYGRGYCRVNKLALWNWIQAGGRMEA